MRPVLAATVLFAATSARADRLKDIAVVRGVRPNQLLGYGLVVGLQGTGDDSSTSFTVQSIVSMLRKLNIRVDSGQLTVRNVGAVVVTGTLPPFARAGGRFDVTVSSIGTAKSLQGGTLLPTPLSGADSRTYAIAEGALSLGGFEAEGRTGGGVRKNHTTVGRIPSGAIVEREVPVELGKGGEILVALREPDFTTATRVAAAVNTALGGAAARASDPGTIVVRIPAGKSPVDLVAMLEALEVTPDVVARVLVNERTGTVVMGEGVRLSPVALAHGGLTVEVKETLTASQPPPLSAGKTVVVPNSEVKATEAPGQVKELAGAATLGDVVRALNALGVTPRDLVAILQGLKAVGALRAELEVQ
jgi:flagellar P-ring protein FlgI